MYSVDARKNSTFTSSNECVVEIRAKTELLQAQMSEYSSWGAIIQQSTWNWNVRDMHEKIKFAWKMHDKK